MQNLMKMLFKLKSGLGLLYLVLRLRTKSRKLDSILTSGSVGTSLNSMIPFLFSVIISMATIDLDIGF